MDARQELFELACQDMPVTGREMNEAIDAFAREIEAEIRQGYSEERE